MQKLWTGRTMQTDNMVAFVISRLKQWQETSPGLCDEVFLGDSAFYEIGLGGGLATVKEWNERVDKTIEGVKKKRRGYMTNPYEHTTGYDLSIQHCQLSVDTKLQEFLRPRIFCFFVLV